MFYSFIRSLEYSRGKRKDKGDINYDFICMLLFSSLSLATRTQSTLFLDLNYYRIKKPDRHKGVYINLQVC